MFERPMNVTMDVSARVRSLGSVNDTTVNGQGEAVSSVHSVRWLKCAEYPYLGLSQDLRIAKSPLKSGPMGGTINLPPTYEQTQSEQSGMDPDFMRNAIFG
jgi:hypothetical protein